MAENRENDSIRSRPKSSLNDIDAFQADLNDILDSEYNKKVNITGVHRHSQYGSTMSFPNFNTIAQRSANIQFDAGVEDQHNGSRMSSYSR